jgi:hypothetical protein
MWWVVRNSSMKSVRSRSGTLPPDLPTYSSLTHINEGLRSLGFIVSSRVRSSLAWLFSQVECRRFIGTVFALIEYTPPALRMVQKETNKGKSCLIFRTQNDLADRQFRDQSRGNKFVRKVFNFFAFCRFLNFEISLFANLNFWILLRSIRPSPRTDIEVATQKSLCDLCETLTRKAAPTCTYVPFTTENSCCRCAVLLKSGTPCRQPLFDSRFTSPVGIGMRHGTRLAQWQRC